MAYSKLGGTRAYLRGRVGADVYTIGRSAAGSKQQVVKARPESIHNVRSEAQQKNRMFMTTASQIAKLLQPLISHSFNDVRAGAPSIAHFKGLLLDAMRADSEKDSPEFGYLPCGGRGVCQVGVPLGDRTNAVLKATYLSQFNQFYTTYGHPSVNIFIPMSGRTDSYKYVTVDDFLYGLLNGDGNSVLTAFNVLVPSDGDASRARLSVAQVEFNQEFFDSYSVDVRSGFTLSGAAVAQNFKWSGLAVNAGGYPICELLETGMFATDAQIGQIFAMQFPDVDGYISMMAGAFVSSIVEGKRTIFASPLVYRWADYLDGETGLPSYYVNPPARYFSGSVPIALSYADALATYPIGDAAFLNGGNA